MATGKTKPTSDQKATSSYDSLEPRCSCRIAIYDDEAATPQVIEIKPTDIRTYIDTITTETVTVLRSYNSIIPFMVVRECIENLIHASFLNPTISILQRGSIIRFSDQGPGITHKEAALQFGTTTATTDMRRYIRGVGSGLPVALQYMQDKGGCLTIEDNLGRGCVVSLYATLPENYLQSQNRRIEKNMHNIKDTGINIADPRVWSHEPHTAENTVQKPITSKETHRAQSPERVSNTSKPPLDTPHPSPSINISFTLNEKEKQAIALCLSREKIGPTDLSHFFGYSLATWSRILQYLVSRGFMKKPLHQQKYTLTSKGKQYATHNI